MTSRTEEVAKDYANACTAFHGYSTHVCVKRGGWIFIGDEYVRVGKLAQRAAKLWEAVAIRNARKVIGK